MLSHCIEPRCRRSVHGLQRCHTHYTRLSRMLVREGWLPPEHRTVTSTVTETIAPSSVYAAEKALETTPKPLSPEEQAEALRREELSRKQSEQLKHDLAVQDKQVQALLEAVHNPPQHPAPKIDITFTDMGDMVLAECRGYWAIKPTQEEAEARVKALMRGTNVS